MLFRPISPDFLWFSAANNPDTVSQPTMTLHKNRQQQSIIFPIFLNISSSVFTVIINKILFKTFDFNFGTFLTFCHFTVTFVVLWISAIIFKAFHLPQNLKIKDILPVSICFCGFVIFTNLSLQYNSVGFYQIAKVLTTPLVVFLEWFFWDKSISQNILLSLIFICFGVVVATFSDVESNFVGAVSAGFGVIFGSFYQILVGQTQKDLNVNSLQLLLYQTPISALILLFAIPFTDSIQDLLAFDFIGTDQFITTLLISSLCAVLVNISVYLIIGKTSAVTYNVIGHTKLLLILLAGWLLFDGAITIVNGLGVMMAIVGVFMYSYVKKIENENDRVEGNEVEDKIELKSEIKEKSVKCSNVLPK